jgi:hypothetical protein
MVAVDPVRSRVRLRQADLDGARDRVARMGIRVVPGRLTGVSVTVANPPAVSARWPEVLGLAVATEPSLELDNARVSFMAAGSGENGGLIEVELTRPGRKPVEALEIGQLVFREADA